MTRSPILHLALLSLIFLTIVAAPGIAQDRINGKGPAKGELFRNPALAGSPEKIGTGGRDAYYRGDIAYTIIPAFITKDGNPFMSFGVMGGAFQPLEHVQIVLNIVDFGMNLQEAGDAPRIDHSGSSEPTGEKMTDAGIVYLESGYSYEAIRTLMNMAGRNCAKMAWRQVTR